MNRDDLSRKVKLSKVLLENALILPPKKNSVTQIGETMDLLVREVERLERELVHRDMADEADIVIGSPVAQVRPTGNFVPIKRDE